MRSFTSVTILALCFGSAPAAAQQPESASVLRYASLNGNIRGELHMLPPVSTGPMSPAWSPDGRWIAFAMAGDIWRVPAGGGPAEQLTRGPQYHFEPSWSPDGSRIAMTVETGEGLDIALLDVASGAVPPCRSLQRLSTILPPSATCNQYAIPHLHLNRDNQHTFWRIVLWLHMMTT